MEVKGNYVYIELVDNREVSLQGYLKYDGYEAISFKGLNQLLVKFDELCNLDSLPQAAVKLRTFNREEVKKEIESSSLKLELDSRNTIVPVFITLRQNASWQGFVLKNEERVPFKSELEFIKLLSQFIE